MTSTKLQRNYRYLTNKYWLYPQKQHRDNDTSAELYSEFNFYIHGSVHRHSILIRSNNMQQMRVFYLLQNYSTCFGCLSYPSPGVKQIATAVSGTGHSVRAKTFRQRGLIWPRWRKVVALTCDMTCTRSCSCNFLYS